MSIHTSAIVLSGTPQRLGSGNSRRSYLEVFVSAGSTAYVGGEDVTTASGVPLTDADDNFIAYSWWSGDTFPGEDFYVVGSGSVRVMERF